MSKLMLYIERENTHLYFPIYSLVDNFSGNELYMPFHPIKILSPCVIIKLRSSETNTNFSIEGENGLSVVGGAKNNP